MNRSLTADVQPAPTRSARLRAESTVAHRDAAGGGFFGRAFDGTMTRDDYAALVVQMRHIYDALESVGSMWVDDERVGRFARPEFARSQRITADLLALLGPAWGVEGAHGTTATCAYAAHLRTRATGDPIVYLAHHYTRVLGDLSGGQMIGKRIESLLDLDASSGTSWFHFDGIDSDEAKVWYRAQVDELALDAAEEQLLIDEVLVAFTLNSALLDSLEAAAT